MARDLPSPQQLAALGAVLCLYRSEAGSELDGWSQAVRVSCESALDSDGLCESLLFFDRDDRVCWRLYLLPDTDFIAWEWMGGCVPGECGAPPGLAERLWRRLARRFGGPAWRASVLRLHAVPTAPGLAGPLLAASLPRLSACGLEAARRIVRREGVECDALFDDRKTDGASVADARIGHGFVRRMEAASPR